MRLLKTFDYNRTVNWASEYFKFPYNNYAKMLQRQGEDFWEKAGQKRALEIFRQAGRDVPAYKDFLKRNKIDPEKIRTLKDFGQVPATTKENYINVYPVEKRSWQGKLKASLVATSSGTTGEPKFWPRGGYQEFEAAITHELLYNQFFKIGKLKTLAIIGFPMGVYVSGMATALPTWLVSQKYPNLTFASVGNNKTEALRVIKNLRGDYEQILLVGHPFFLKDVIETGKTQGIKWDKKILRLMFCSEGFSESWREYLLKEAGINSPAGAINTYGSSELLLMAYETPLSIRLRSQMEKNPTLALALLGQTDVPNFFQYNPFLRFVEEQGKELLFTASSGLPLIRFNLHDSGKIIPYSQVQKTHATTDAASWKLPFLALWGRSDHTIIFYAANIYPQNISAALSHGKFFKKITGKFSLRKDYKKNMDEFLEINLELRPKVLPTKKLANLVTRKILDTLKKVNMEYAFLSVNLEKDLTPRIKFWPYQHSKYFKVGLKPKYII